ncbi:MAG: 2'-5' RNA ligase family protein [Roseobacter sp.]
MADTSNVLHSVWLCPGSQSMSQFRSIIEEFRTLSGTAAFAPHITLLGDLSGCPKQTERNCRDVLGHLGPLHARVREVSRSDAFFMSLLLDLELTPEIDACRDVLAKSLMLPAQELFRPHLSLAYGLSQKQSESDDIVVRADAFVELVFPLTHLAIVVAAQNTPICDWRHLRHIPMG